MITLTLKYETCLDLFTESMSGCVFSHTHTNIQMLLAVLKADHFNPFTDHKSLWNISHRSLVREDATTINRKATGKCMSLWM